jgi:uncharacterized protein (TIGR00369 family)
MTPDERQLLDGIHEIANRIPFNRVLGLEVVSLENLCAEVRFDMRPELVGNFSRGILHGGVISAVHDLTGGLVAFLGMQQKLTEHTLADRLERFGRLGTIDLRVDYLRPGAGEWFVCKGRPLRTGNKVAVAQMELFNHAGELISAATAAYTVS